MTYIVLKAPLNSNQPTLCRVAHKANSLFLHLVRSSAATSASSDDMSRSLSSHEMVWLQVVRGLPRPLLSGSFQFMACFGSLYAFMRVRCPYNSRPIFQLIQSVVRVSRRRRSHLLLLLYLCHHSLLHIVGS